MPVLSWNHYFDEPLFNIDNLIIWVRQGSCSRVTWPGLCSDVQLIVVICFVVQLSPVAAALHELKQMPTGLPQLESLFTDCLHDTEPCLISRYLYICWRLISVITKACHWIQARNCPIQALRTNFPKIRFTPLTLDDYVEVNWKGWREKSVMACFNTASRY